MGIVFCLVSPVVLGNSIGICITLKQLHASAFPTSTLFPNSFSKSGRKQSSSQHMVVAFRDLPSVLCASTGCWAIRYQVVNIIACVSACTCVGEMFVIIVFLCLSATASIFLSMCACAAPLRTNTPANSSSHIAEIATTTECSGCSFCCCAHCSADARIHTCSFERRSPECEKNVCNGIDGNNGMCTENKMW